MQERTVNLVHSLHKTLPRNTEYIHLFTNLQILARHVIASAYKKAYSVTKICGGVLSFCGVPKLPEKRFLSAVLAGVVQPVPWSVYVEQVLLGNQPVLVQSELEGATVAKWYTSSTWSGMESFAEIRSCCMSVSYNLLDFVNLFSSTNTRASTATERNSPVPSTQSPRFCPPGTLCPVSVYGPK